MGSTIPPLAGTALSYRLTTNPVCYNQSGGSVLDSEGIYSCQGLGRYVTVQLLGDGFNASAPVLRLCQVAVSAALPPPSPPPSPPPANPVCAGADLHLNGAAPASVGTGAMNNTGALGGFMKAAFANGTYYDSVQSAMVYPQGNGAYALLTPFWLDNGGLSVSIWAKMAAFTTYMRIFDFGSGVGGLADSTQPYILLGFYDINTVVVSYGSNPNRSDFWCSFPFRVNVYYHFALAWSSVSNPLAPTLVPTLLVSGLAVPCAWQNLTVRGNGTIGGNRTDGTLRTSAYLGRSQYGYDGAFAGAIADFQACIPCSSSAPLPPPLSRGLLPAGFALSATWVLLRSCGFVLLRACACAASRTCIQQCFRSLRRCCEPRLLLRART